LASMMTAKKITTKSKTGTCCIKNCLKYKY
jgi:hypothetical protein